ncbi:zinc dependent phospholipase C family protein [[Clostridium] polysaccharolyticum]|uniref:PLAT/LH2 domain-containing protein n=1 Tax=[Clostridium] polysaccharolyticum TaxID=29364 RepID=A0A1H9Y691_9FIRM|nr:zinc dependent phospholipase C family protein [[Clostridium] polysaccharolyticum]SES63941.1 PLAT/LH2 domain-containing protein [[Clostridium] polysaccharolyticum]
MKLRKKGFCIMLGCAILGTICGNGGTVNAFKPASHYALVDRVADELPAKSLIKKAIETYPHVAAWGAVGPDLGYGQIRGIAGYAPWADRYHYYKVGTFAKELMKEALASNDLVNIAFAAGWISHISGDLACHGIFVNPECGVYLDNEKTRDLHGELESKAEPYVWAVLGGYGNSTYTESYLSKAYADKDKIPFDLLNRICEKVYHTSESVNTEKLWADAISVGLSTGVGYTYENASESLQFLNQNGRKKRLEQAFSLAKVQCASLLKQAEKGDYSSFTDRWNLDVGESQSPISSLTVTVKTGTKSGAGTDDDVYFKMETRSGDQKSWLLDKAGYDDFENGDKDEYYLYLNDARFTPDNVKKVWIEKKKVKFSIGEAWYLSSVDINVNGTAMPSKKIEKWLNGNDSISYAVDWSSVENTSDPVIKE